MFNEKTGNGNGNGNGAVPTYQGSTITIRRDDRRRAAEISQRVIRIEVNSIRGDEMIQLFARAAATRSDSTATLSAMGALWALRVLRALWTTAALLSGCLLGALGALLPLEAERLHASVGGFAVFNCHLDFPFGNEIPYHLQWDKDGEKIFSWYSGEREPQVADRWGGRVRRLPASDALGRGSINVSAVRETDAGLYRCRVTFPNRTPPSRNNGTFYYLDVDGGNLIVTPPTNVTVIEGGRAELECLPKNPESVVQWYKDGVPLSELPELAARSELAANGSLVLRTTTSSDPGEYECHVRAPDGQLQSASAALDVHYKAKVVYAPEERFLPFGKPASLDCHFSANPPLTNLRWEKDGFLFDPYNVPGVFYSRNGSLLFNQVDESHEGQYSCTPYNALGTEGASPGVRVRVQRPPAFAARPQPLYLVRLGATLTAPCALQEAARHDAPIVQWSRKDGRELPPGRHSLDGGNLTISAIAEEDRGVYVCTATNEAASVSVETELLIENVPPRAPYNLTAAASAQSIRVAWAPGDAGASVECVVWYRERAASEWRTMRLLSRGVTHATLVGLRPGAEYEIRVLAQDHIGDGLFSKPLYVRTLPQDVDATREEEGSFAAAVTEGAEGAEGAEAVEGAEEAESDERVDELEVSVRLLEEGALVRWHRVGDGERCTVRWYRQEAPADRLLSTTHTQHDYALVGAVEEGAHYGARVQCARAHGGASVHVPEYGRLRAVAAGSAAAALLLAALAAVLYLTRHRLRAAVGADRSRSRAEKRVR